MRTLAARLLFSAVLVAGVALATASPSTAALAFGATDPLGTYPMPFPSSSHWGGGVGRGINDAGTIVGVTPEDGSLTGTGFELDPSTHATGRLGTWGDSGQDSSGSAINDTGHSTGQVFLTDATDATRAARFTQAPSIIDLVASLGGNHGDGHDINDSGYVVGDSTLPGDLVTHAFVADPGLAPTDIGVLPGGQSSTASGIDENGLVVGTSEVGGTAPCLHDPASTCPRTHAFTYDVDTATLTDLGALLPGGASSEATDINDTGTVVGSIVQPGPGGTSTTHPFSYDLDTATFHDLGLLPGTTVGRATGVNDDGVVVGNIADDGAWVHDPADGQLAAVPGVSRLEDINNRGMAVGSGLVPEGVDGEGNLLPGTVVGSIRMQVLVAPRAPTLLRAATCGNATELAWEPPLHTGYATTGVTYQVLRDGAVVGTTANRSFADPGVHTGSAYSVRTVNAAGASAPSAALVGACASSIRGTVTADGTPVGGIDVRVYPAGSGLVAAKATTATDGSFAVGGLAPGSYQVRFHSATMTYLTQWNGDVHTRAEAGVVVVGAGTTTVDAELAVPGVVEGTAGDASGPVAGIAVRAYPTGVPFAFASTTTATDGTYRLDRLPAGSYEIRFSSPSGGHVLQWNGGAPTRAAATPVVVTTTSATTVDAVLVPAGTLVGRMRVPGPFGTSLYAGGVEVRAYPVGAPAVAKTTTSADGGFSLGALPAGAYQLRVTDPVGRLPGIRWLHDDGTMSGDLTLVDSRSAATAFAVVGGEVLDVGTFLGQCGCWIG